METRSRIAPLLFVVIACGSEPDDAETDAAPNEQDGGTTGDAGQTPPMTGAAADCAAYCAAQEAGNCNVPENCGTICESRVELIAECSDVMRENMRCLANDGFVCEGPGQIRTNTDACTALSAEQTNCIAMAMQSQGP